MSEAHIAEVETSADFFDFAVADIAYVRERPPDPEWRIRHFTNNRSHILAFAVAGTAHYELAGQHRTVTSGDLLFMPAGTPHTAASDPDDPWHFRSVAFGAGGVGAIALDKQLESLPFVTSGTASVVPSLFAEMSQLWGEQSPGYIIGIRSRVTEVMHALIREHSVPLLREPHARRIHEITRVILENYASTYSVDELAAMAGLSASHFRLVFKKVTGLSPIAYQQRIKITKATEFLTSGEFNVTESAVRAGFTNVYYFSRLYKKVTGKPPSALNKR
ncbi:helix-turn-helix transcriptional regulator [Microbacterium sp. ISL-59]|jgi:AraC-like DNA-binding protein|uniref:helix-turn-helix domain-containing protein n=1 Tax=Microbacterium sp. ISL-59 TaxID=2819159 RepID=UPI001BE6974A|nr:AraC family transcriptional regulator [Microbacterium sp. ISL-59]MBT2496688.1 helix-turn-helix transcriptional regulator [Microbacterium sp. ISL-59]